MTGRLVENKGVYPWRRAFWKPNSSLQLNNREPLSRIMKYIMSNYEDMYESKQTAPRR